MFLQIQNMCLLTCKTLSNKKCIFINLIYVDVSECNRTKDEIGP